MKDSEKNATGLRYLVLPIFCGVDVLRQAGRSTGICGAGRSGGVGLPLDLAASGKLRAHFGDKSGALDAVKQGLKLEPGDYEFLTLKKEIKAGATLEQMEYHWIDPDSDQALQQGLAQDIDEKQRALACIRVDEAGLAEFYELSAQNGMAMRKIPPAVNSNTR